MSNLPSIQQHAAPLPWLRGTELLAQALKPGLVQWLTYEGLLTPRLREAFSNPVDLELLRQEPVNTGPDGHGWLREVSLSSQGLRLVYALSWFPSAVMLRHPWLRELDARPLGDALAQRAHTRRSAFEFRATTPGDPRYERAIQGYPERPATLWARRSRFNLPGGDVLVEEVFLPSLYREIR